MKTTRFGMRGLCGAFAVGLSVGLGLPTRTEDEPQWVRQLGTPMDDNATGVATDGDGNVYTAGLTNGSLGGPHESGLYDAWVAKYSAAGALRWTWQLGTSHGCGDRWIRQHLHRRIYRWLARGTPPGRYYNAWLAKYSAAGALRWKRQLGTFEGEAASGVATDGDGNVYIAGWTGGDALVAKYSPAGALRWVRRLEHATANGVATDGEANVYIADWIGSALSPLSIPRRAHCSGCGDSRAPQPMALRPMATATSTSPDPRDPIKARMLSWRSIPRPVHSAGDGNSGRQRRTMRAGLRPIATATSTSPGG